MYFKYYNRNIQFSPWLCYCVSVGKFFMFLYIILLPKSQVVLYSENNC